MGIGTILRSHEIWVLATGAGKAGIVREILQGPIGIDVPASLLREHPRAWLFADEAAASLVPAESAS
jgi:glucosamine-6-phosphate deaminase